MSLAFRAATATDIGLGRTNNEDSAFAGKRLVAVADGMGGLPAGELASDIAIKAMATLEHATGRDHGGDPTEALRRAAEIANRRIREKAQADAVHDGMGTTLTALLMSTDSAGADAIGLLNVGDSRCYLLRDGTLTQVTRDDTFVQSLVDEGVLSPRDARSHPRRSVVMQALQGVDYTATCAVLQPRVGDRFLLCSDGLSDFVEDDAIASVLRKHDNLSRCARALVRLALDAGGPDNVTVIVTDVVAH